VKSPPSGGVAPNAATPGGTKVGGTTGSGSTGAGVANGATKAGATPDVAELEVVVPPVGGGQTGANAGARAAPSCGGPNELAVGEEGVFTAPDKAAEQFAWAPDEPGMFDVVLDGPTGVVCLTPVSVVDVAAGTSEVVSP
jgi:hypothetical protein